MVIPPPIEITFLACPNRHLNIAHIMYTLGTIFGEKAIGLMIKDHAFLPYQEIPV